MNTVTIIIPVYGDWPSLSECISSLKEHVDTTLHPVMLVNDCGPEAELIERNIQAAIKDVPGFTYHRNKKNLGFVGNCNHAVLTLEKTNNDILLLNSDTKVTAGFLDEMLAVLYATPRHGAVSPRSNNATIATIPLSAAVQKGVAAPKSYQLYQKIKPLLPRYQVVPVAHGFCMLIRRKLIKQYGLFDKAFGKGYGEEVDFCMRIAKHGYKSVLANRAYVFHLEARSFTPEVKSKLLEANNKILWERYPKYRQSVRDYMAAAIPREQVLEQEAGIRPSLDARSVIKKLIKSNPKVHALARQVRKRL
ncbi:MAG TPA: glycosyltransferase family 2 protein [Candidatus Limnocylindria bacterium]|nr:glycosyltransferase family 2 protein [Candidatus Limnocylindria bacterium]